MFECCKTWNDTEGVIFEHCNRRSYLHFALCLSRATIFLSFSFFSFFFLTKKMMLCVLSSRSLNEGSAESQPRQGFGAGLGSELVAVCCATRCANPRWRRSMTQPLKVGPLDCATTLSSLKVVTAPVRHHKTHNSISTGPLTCAIFFKAWCSKQVSVLRYQYKCLHHEIQRTTCRVHTGESET